MIGPWDEGRVGADSQVLSQELGMVLERVAGDLSSENMVAGARRQCLVKAE